MPPPGRDTELRDVIRLREHIERNGVNVPGLLRLCQRYEELHVTIDQFALDRANISFWDQANLDRHAQYVRILTHSLRAVAGQLELLRQENADEFRAAMNRRRRRMAMSRRRR
jgi:hypothetical protein